MRFWLLFNIFYLFCINMSHSKTDFRLAPSPSDIIFEGVPCYWDNALPLGNSIVGAMIWQHESKLRLSLDRIDLWDLRPSDFSFSDGYNFDWVKQKIKENKYEDVQNIFDVTYDESAAPSKISGASIELSIPGKPIASHLYLNNALCEVKYDNGIVIKTFVHAEKPIGWFFIENCSENMPIDLIAPDYSGDYGKQSKNSLSRLGYSKGLIEKTGSMIHYHQKGWGDFFYDVVVTWKFRGNVLYGVWSITSSLSETNASNEALVALNRGIDKDYSEHLEYWNRFMENSSISIPDKKLQAQYDREIYKIGSLAKENSYPISLQGVWTTDNGLLPPWKGDYHHDLNTELSYWPMYTGNYLSQAKGFVNSLWSQREVYRQFTREFFGKEGLNVPGVCTLDGKPMGGWIQYAMSQTTSAWLSFHFYLQWKYSMDISFLKDMAYPFVKEVAEFLQQQTIVDDNGMRTLEYSSSPEMYNNSKEAWFSSITNYDLSLLYKHFDIAEEMALYLGLTDDANLWAKLKKQLPNFSYDENGGFSIAQGYPYNSSHRHFSHAMSIYPLGIVDVKNSIEEAQTIKKTLEVLDMFGDNAWNGYSYSWLANMKARALDGDGAVEALHRFVDHYCSLNSFHVNEYSGKDEPRIGRPFTLEGNLAFAAGIQEILLQSHRESIDLFPALPSEWKNVSINNFRTIGAFLITAELKDGKLVYLKIISEKGGRLSLKSEYLSNRINMYMKPGEEFIYKFNN